MLHAGLDLSRNRLDVCLLSDQGEIVAEFGSRGEAEGRATSADRTPYYAPAAAASGRPIAFSSSIAM
jgi:hypothetical protein